MWCLHGVKRDKVLELRSIIPVSEAVAIRILQQSEWNMEHACKSYLEGQKNYLIQSELDNLVMRYTNNLEKMHVDGIGLDLNLNANSIYALLLAWKSKAKRQWMFTRAEFCQGINALEINNIMQLKKKFSFVDQELRNQKEFRNFYLFVFEYATQPNNRHLYVNMAIGYWYIVLRDHFIYLHDWCSFLKETKKNFITKDSWNLLFDFALNAEEHISNYDAAGSWPVLVDEFVDWFKQKQKNLDSNIKTNKDTLMQEL